MALISAGILMYRKRNNAIEVFLVHPGGPFFKNKDKGIWTIPKGLAEEGEDLETAAMREFEEEVGLKVKGKLIPLGDIIHKGGKRVYSWATKGDIPDKFIIKSNYFVISWPPGSGQLKKFPEIDRAEFFSLEAAKEKIISAQAEFIERLQNLLK